MAHPISDDMLIDHLAVLAKTGKGKTYMAKSIVERLLEEKRRVCIVDPKDAWWGLKSSSDGKAPAFPIVVFGGPHADVPLLAAHGHVLGEAIATGHLSCVICTKGMPEKDRIRFLTDFFQSLDMKNSEPLHLVLDEAHMMAPQKPLGEMQRLTHWTSELVSGGRGMGFRIILLSQRPARLNKDVLTQCETLVAMGMTGIQDRDAVKAWIHDQADLETGKEIVASLPKLQKGEGWLWAPALDILKRVQFPLIKTYDNSKTKKDGKADAKAKLAPVDLSALEQKLGKVKDEIAANDPAALKRKVAELERALKTATDYAARADNHEAKQDRDVHLLSESWNAGWDAATKEFAKYRGKVEKMWDTYQRILLSSAEKLEKFELPVILREVAGDVPKDLASFAAEVSAPTPDFSAFGKRVVRPPVPIYDHKPAVRNGGAPLTPAPVRVSDGLSKPQQGIVDGLAWWLAAGKTTVTRAQLAGIVGKSPSSGGFNNLIGGLVTAGVVEIPTPGSVSLTVGGRELANFQEVGGTEELHARVQGALSAPQWEILAVAIAAYPEPLTREQVAERLNPPKSPSSGGFNNLIGSLCTLDLLHKPRPGAVAASDWLFPF